MANNEAKIRFTAETHEFNAAIKRSQSTMTGLRAEMKLADATFKNTGDSASYLEQKHKILEQELAANHDKQEALTQKLEAANRIYGENSKEAQKIATQLTRAKTEEQNLESAVNQVNDEIQREANGMDEAADSTRGAGEAARGAEGGFTVLKGALANLTSDAIRTGLNEIKQFMQDTVAVGMDFDTAMSQLAATMGLTVDDISELENTAQEMGASTKFTATEAAEGLNILAQSGLNADEQMAGIATVLDLASAGAMSLEDAASYTTATVKGFSDGMENAQYYADLMAKGATLANTDVRGLGEALSASSANAAAYGQNAESVTIALLKLAEGNVTGSEAATSLNRAMADLYTPTDNAVKAINDLGVHTYDAEGKARDFNEICSDLSAALSGMSEEEQNSYKNMIFTTNGLRAFNMIANVSTEKSNAFAEGLGSSMGSAAQQAATQIDNLEGDLTIMDSALDGLKLNLYDGIEPVLRDIVGTMTDDIIPALSSAVDWCQQNADVIGIVASAIGGVVVAIGVYNGAIAIKAAMDAVQVKTLGALAAAQWAVVAPTLAAMAPYIAIGAAIGAVIAVIVLCIKHWDEISAKMQEVKQKMVDIATGIREKVAGIWEEIGSKIKEPIDNAKKHIDEIIEKIRTTIENCKPKLDIKIPHVSVSGGVAPWGIAGKGKLPSFDVTWNALGAIFDRPTIFSTRYGLQGVGEAGPEAVTPISVLQDYVETSVARVIGNLINYDLMASKIAVACSKLNVNISVDNREFGRIVREVI